LEHVTVKLPVIRSLTASTLLTIGVTVGGFGTAAAQPTDYSILLINPNEATDSMAYTAAAPPTVNPNGQPGASGVYSHRDGTRQITNTILVLPDAAAATNSLNGSNVAGKVANGKTAPAPVGTGGGTMVSGTSPDGSKSVTVLQFAQGNTATTIEFDGPTNDPAPSDMVIEFGQKQAAAIKNGLAV
jgi:hypothetical protein